jgi:hypothetical protein
MQSLASKMLSIESQTENFATSRTPRQFSGKIEFSLEHPGVCAWFPVGFSE